MLSKKPSDGTRCGNWQPKIVTCRYRYRHYWKKSNHFKDVDDDAPKNGISDFPIGCDASTCQNRSIGHAIRCRSRHWFRRRSVALVFCWLKTFLPFEDFLIYSMKASLYWPRTYIYIWKTDPNHYCDTVEGLGNWWRLTDTEQAGRWVGSISVYMYAP